MITKTVSSWLLRLVLAIAALPSLAHAQSLSLSLNPTEVVGSATSTGTVTLSQPASQATVVALSSDQSFARTPDSVTIGAGSSSATFSVTTKVVATSASATIAAKEGASSATASLAVDQPTVRYLEFGFTEGQYVTDNVGRVILSAAAPANGIKVNLTCDNPALHVPAYVTVPHGCTEYIFHALSDVVYQEEEVNVSAQSCATDSTRAYTWLEPFDVSSLTLSTDKALHGRAVVGTVSLSWTAPPFQSVNVTLECDCPSAAAPTVVQVKPGKKTATFSFTPHATAGRLYIEFKASAGGRYTFADLAIDGTGLANSSWPKFHGNAGNISVGYGTPLLFHNPYWTFATAGQIVTEAVTGPDGTIYFGSDDHYLYAVSSSGALLWKDYTGGSVTGTPAVGANGLVYFGSADRKVYAVNAKTGARVWVSSVDGAPMPINMAADGTVYASCANDQGGEVVYALNPKTGSRIWTELPGPAALMTPIAVGANGFVYGASRSHVFALSPVNGHRVWSKIPDGTVDFSPYLVVGPDDKVYASYAADAYSFYDFDERVRPVLYAFDGTTGGIVWQQAISFTPLDEMRVTSLSMAGANLVQCGARNDYQNCGEVYRTNGIDFTVGSVTTIKDTDGPATISTNFLNSWYLASPSETNNYFFGSMINGNSWTTTDYVATVSIGANQTVYLTSGNVLTAVGSSGSP
ncbi:MAG TPA: PQQ-binding-like beta-propeller repeat protein [Fimbriimonas sp.]|nr:PQQ-binding-like beta-propeller repeat protein [Fimbriimonas sp.]